jgi:DNA polymerase-1
MRDVPLKQIAEYAAEDADITLRLRSHLLKELEKHSLTKLCTDIEFPLIPVLCAMELNGVAIDEKMLQDVSKDLERQLQSLEIEIHHLAGEKFNINSTKQLQEILFTKLKLQPTKKTKTGFSTDVFVLEELSSQHPIAEKLLEYRTLGKLKSTYIDALPQLINPHTGRVHTTFNQTVTNTGRLSSSDPNLQNIPIRTEIGREIRKAFVPGEKNTVLMSADYSQIELRIMAHISGDEGLVKAFQTNEDIHTATAANVFGVKPKDVTPDMRRKAKEVNFGIMYGIGPFGLKTRLGISQAEAKEIIDIYFRKYPKVNQYISETIAKARRLGYVETLLGRRRYFTNLNSKNAAVRQSDERAAINMPVQGTAADMMKIAMVLIHEAMKKEHFASKMILQVHDELVFEVPKNE